VKTLRAQRSANTTADKLAMYVKRHEQQILAWRQYYSLSLRGHFEGGRVGPPFTVLKCRTH